MKKLNNKGFTLVELLAVIIILILIVSIAIPSISASIERTNKKQTESKKQLLISAAELYLSDHKKTRINFYNGKCYIDVQNNLINKKYITAEEITINGETVGKYIIYSSNSLLVIDNINTNLEECS